MKGMKRLFIRSLPLSLRIDSALRERGYEPVYDYESDSEEGNFFFDDGLALRSLLVPSRFHEADPADIEEVIASSEYFKPRERGLMAALASEEGVVLYWPAEKTPLERLFARPLLSARELLPAEEPTSVSESVQTEAPEIPAPAAPREVEIHDWHGIAYSVCGHTRGGVFRKSYLLQRQDRLCFAMMTGARERVLPAHEDFVQFLKGAEDWPEAHRSYQSRSAAMDTATLVIDQDAQCRFFCAGVQPLYWSGRLKKLMRFPNTEHPLNSRLHTGDFLLLLPGGWTAREAAELRELFLYPESMPQRLSAFLDYNQRGRGILIQCKSGENS